ncbi:Uncharacterised protein [Burkholderia pseudomallei]|nr:Uncharacterised protein [Burkholderia pseudomallei]
MYACGTNFSDDEDEYKRAVESSRAAWLAKWPRHCGRCHGSQGDYNPAIDDLVRTCSCAADGVCPRCSASMDVDSGHCEACGWRQHGQGQWLTADDFHCP